MSIIDSTQPVNHGTLLRHFHSCSHSVRPCRLLRVMLLSRSDATRSMPLETLGRFCLGKTSELSVAWLLHWGRPRHHKDAQFNALALTIFGAGYTLGQTAMLRRLHFEATTLMIASVKQRVDGEAADKAEGVKRIPVAEKRFRQEQQERRLTGITMTGEMEPSHQLLDLTNNILETGSLVWIAPRRCTKRSDEVQLSIKERPSSVQIENQQLKVSQVPDEFKADYGSEIKLQWCWQRRGLAMDQCKLLSWEVHDSWIHQLFRTFSHHAGTSRFPASAHGAACEGRSGAFEVRLQEQHIGKALQVQQGIPCVRQLPQTRALSRGVQRAQQRCSVTNHTHWLHFGVRWEAQGGFTQA